MLRRSRPAIGAVLAALLVVGAPLGILPLGDLSHSVVALIPPTGSRSSANPAAALTAPTGPVHPAGAASSTDLPTPPQPLGEGRSGASTVALTTALEAAGVPLRYAFLPNLDARANDQIRDGHIEPTYSTIPAPMGLADLGLENESGTIVATELTSSRIAGTFAPTALSGISPDSGAPDAYGVQVNAVLTNVTLFGNSTYQFWTQNVVEYSTFSHQLEFLDNVWNFSGGSGALSSNAIEAHGANGTQVGTTFYYALGPVVTMDYPFTLSLFLDSGTTASGDVVYFNYTLTNATQTLSGSYDYVEFNSTDGTSPGTFPAPTYLADGASYNPLGIPDDFEIDVVGPGGGSNFDAFNASAALNLYYWSVLSQRFLIVPSAFDAGAETGETSSGLSSTWTTNGDVGLRGTAGPAGHLGQGPSVLTGEWGVDPSTEGMAVLVYQLAPSNGFTFIGAGASPPLSAYGWAPVASSYDLPPGNYSVWSLASEFAPAQANLTLPLGGTSLVVALMADPAAGVYTPLWATDESDVSNISSSCSAGPPPALCTLDNDEVGPLGNPGPFRGSPGSGTVFPWFGTFNDFFFPEFPGIFLWNVSNVAVASPPAFEVGPPSWLENASSRYGTPASNDLGLFFYDDDRIFLENGAAIGGWWFEPAYFGPSAPQYSVVFWNTTDSWVVGNTFTTGGGALYLYGGEANTVLNNTFLEYIPLAPNPGAVSGAVHGTIGLFDADFSDANSSGTACAVACDRIYNNQFGDYHTAFSPTLDPYTGLAPRLPFDDLWNLAPRPGPNILGGAEVGGNYWWNFGTSNDPYWTLPYNASGAIAWGGDADPIVPTPLWSVTFAVTGLPLGVVWHLGVYTSTGVAFETSSSPTLVQPWPVGEYFFTADSLDGTYGIPSTGVFEVYSANLTVPLAFHPLFTLTFTSTNFPTGSFWAITLSNPTFGGFIDLGNVAQFPAETLASGIYNYTISPPAGYTVSPLDGSVNLTQNSTIALAFSEEGAPGELYVSLSPADGAQVWVDTQLITNSSTGAFNLSLPAGLHSIRASAPGYYPYFNNVTIQGGGETQIAIDFVPLANGCCNASTTTELPWVLAGIFGAVAVGLAILLAAVYARRPPPPARAPYVLGPYTQR